MADILLINGSPRPRGNSARLAEACAGVFEREGVGWERIDLRALKIGPCLGCWSCRDGRARYCVQDDDMTALYGKLRACRGLLLLTPVYWFNVTAQLKGFIDRLDGLWHWERAFLEDKPAGAVLVYMDAGPELSGACHAMASLEHLFRYVGADFRGFAHGRAEHPGDAEGNPELMESARRLALKLAR